LFDGAKVEKKWVSARVCSNFILTIQTYIVKHTAIQILLLVVTEVVSIWSSDT